MDKKDRQFWDQLMDKPVWPEKLVEFYNGNLLETLGNLNTPILAECTRFKAGHRCQRYLPDGCECGRHRVA